MADRRCGTCKHYSRYRETISGNCEYPLPVIAMHKESYEHGLVFASMEAKNCPCWEPKEKSDGVVE